MKAARAIALDYIERLAKGPEEEPPARAGELSLKELADKYEVEGFYGRTKGRRAKAKK